MPSIEVFTCQVTALSAKCTKVLEKL